MKINKTYTFNIHDRIFNLTEDDAVELYNVLKTSLSAVVTEVQSTESQQSQSSVVTDSNSNVQSVESQQSQSSVETNVQSVESQQSQSSVETPAES